MLPPLLTTTDVDNYEAYLEEKIYHVRSLLSDALGDELEFVEPLVCPSKPQHYRMRAEFSIFHHSEGHFDYIMFEKGSNPKKMLFIDQFPSCTESINQAMSLLRKHLNKTNYPVVAKKLFSVEFLTNQAGEVVITLIYHKKLDEHWMEQANALHLAMKEETPDLHCSLVAHAKKQKLVIGQDYVIESIQTRDREIKLKQVEGTFSQPNATACQAMLNFAMDCAKSFAGEDGKVDGDLIELYCGSGTFTAALAPYFRRAFATEVSRVPTETALYNMKLNGIDNIALVRLSALEVTQALNQEREFRRLKLMDIDLNSYDFKLLLIDPPRAGLQDEAALAFTARFDRIIYISCGPESLASDLKYLTKTHKVERLAFFDQFPYTPHLESGVLLVRR